MSHALSPLLCIAAFSLLFASCQDRIAPAMNPRVVVDEGRIEKRSVTAVEGIGAIACLQRCALKRGGEVELIAVGTQGYARIDSATFAVRAVVGFPAAARSGPMVVRDLDGDGEVEFVRLGESWIGRTAAFDQQGRMRWEDGDDVTKRAPNATAVVDFDGDGRCEIVTAFNVAKTLRVADCDNKPLREIPCEQQTGLLYAVDIDGDGKEALACLSGGGLRVVRGDGSVRLRIRAEDCGFLSELDVIADPRADAKKGARCFLLGGSKGVSLWTMDGERIDAGDAPTTGRRLANFDGNRVTANFGGVAWDMRAQLLRQQAPIAGFLATRLSVRFFDGKLAYEEVLRARQSRETLSEFAMLALDAEGDRPACVLVGYGPDLICYSAR